MVSEPASGSALHLTRDIPVPTSVSPEAQELIAAGQRFVARRLARPVSTPALDDTAGWKAMIAALDKAMAADLGPRVGALDARVEHVHVDGVGVFDITPGESTARDLPVQCFFHGGSLIAGAGDVCRLLGTVAAARAGIRTWAVDYRMPPDHPYPAALDDACSVYRALVAERPAEQVVVAGRSAGGNLAAALLLKARAEGLPMPACLVLQTPEVDLTECGDTFETNQHVDYLLQNRLSASIALYAGGHDLRDPHLSPLFGDLRGFPPSFLQSGTRDLFLSNTVRMHRALRAAAVDAELHVWEAMPHGGFPDAPEDDDLVREMRCFLSEHV